MKTKIFRFISISLSVLITLQNVSFAGSFNAQDTPQTISHLPNIYIPESYGKIEKSMDNGLWTMDSPKRPLVVLVKDAHCHYEAQKNIAKILDILIKDYNIDLIGVEGASRKVDPSIIADSPDSKKREETAEKYLKKGYLSASEALAMEKGKNYGFSIWGVEDLKMYLNNLKEFRTVYSNSGEAERFIQTAQNLISNLKNKLYPQDALLYDKKVSEYKNNKLPITEYITCLYGMNRAEFVKRRNLKLVFTAIRLEKSVDFNRVENERAQLIKEIEQKFPKEDIQELVQKSLLYKLGKLSSLGYYRYLNRFIPNRSHKKYSNLERYIRNIKIHSKIDENELFNEINTLTEKIYQGVIIGEIPQKLHSVDEQVYLMGKLLRLEITRDELSLCRNGMAMPKAVEFLRIQCGAQGINIPPEYNDPSFIDKTGQFCVHPEQFYEYALERDNLLIENLLSKMKEEGKSRSVLIVGGFHADGVEKLLSDKGIQTLTICPSITKEDTESRKIYLSRMMDKNIQPDKILAEFGLNNLAEPRATAVEFREAMKTWLAEIARGAGELVEGLKRLTDEDRLAAIRGFLDSVPEGEAGAIARGIIGEAFPELVAKIPSAPAQPAGMTVPSNKGAKAAKPAGRSGGGLYVAIAPTVGWYLLGGAGLFLGLLILAVWILRPEIVKMSRKYRSIPNKSDYAYAETIVQGLLKIYGITKDYLEYENFKAEETMNGIETAIFSMMQDIRDRYRGNDKLTHAMIKYIFDCAKKIMERKRVKDKIDVLIELGITLSDIEIFSRLNIGRSPYRGMTNVLLDIGRMFENQETAYAAWVWVVNSVKAILRQRAHKVRLEDKLPARVISDFDPEDTRMVLPSYAKILADKKGKADTRDMMTDTMTIALGIDYSPELRELARRILKYEYESLNKFLRRGKIGPIQRETAQYIRELEKSDPAKAGRLKDLLSSRSRSNIVPDEVSDIEPFTESAELGELFGYSEEDILLYGIENYLKSNGITAEEFYNLAETWRYGIPKQKTVKPKTRRKTPVDGGVLKVLSVLVPGISILTALLPRNVLAAAVTDTGFLHSVSAFINSPEGIVIGLFVFIIFAVVLVCAGDKYDDEDKRYPKLQPKETEAIKNFLYQVSSFIRRPRRGPISFFKPQRDEGGITPTHVDNEEMHIKAIDSLLSKLKNARFRPLMSRLKDEHPMEAISPDQVKEIVKGLIGKVIYCAISSGEQSVKREIYYVSDVSEPEQNNDMLGYTIRVVGNKVIEEIQFNFLKHGARLSDGKTKYWCEGPAIDFRTSISIDVLEVESNNESDGQSGEEVHLELAAQELADLLKLKKNKAVIGELIGILKGQPNDFLNALRGLLIAGDITKDELKDRLQVVFESSETVMKVLSLAQGGLEGIDIAGIREALSTYVAVNKLQALQKEDEDRTMPHFMKELGDRLGGQLRQKGYSDKMIRDLMQELSSADGYYMEGGKAVPSPYFELMIEWVKSNFGNNEIDRLLDVLARYKYAKTAAMSEFGAETTGEIKNAEAVYNIVISCLKRKESSNKAIAEIIARYFANEDEILAWFTDIKVRGEVKKGLDRLISRKAVYREFSGLKSVGLNGSSGIVDDVDKKADELYYLDSIGIRGKGAVSGGQAVVTAGETAGKVEALMDALGRDYVLPHRDKGIAKQFLSTLHAYKMAEEIFAEKAEKALKDVRWQADVHFVIEAKHLVGNVTPQGNGTYLVEPIGEGAVWFLRNAIASGQLRILYDSNKPAEREAVRIWLKEHGMILKDEVFITQYPSEDVLTVSILSDTTQVPDGLKNHRIIMGNYASGDMILLSRMALLLAQQNVASEKMESLLLAYYDVDKIDDLHGDIKTIVEAVLRAIGDGTTGFTLPLPPMAPFIKVYLDALKINREFVANAA